ncbi:IclR family transcriptional regulator [Agilicoccus flavus]|uniref:IclR family transcriptional regulator n=1 Tax=Agilicoccus flavus TaxID=2775968 RepID=UPI001CF61E56|nr:IclR family transcriptional regulator [Agilicoccus flavus]
MRNNAEATVQSVDRAVTILELLARDGTLGVTALSRELDVHKSTASRLVSALEQRGLVEQVEERGGYRLGPGIVRLAGATDARLDLVTAARPVCRRLAAETGETVNLATLSAGAALYVDQAGAGHNLSGYNWVGQRIPLHATSNGKILLSELDEPDLAALVEELVGYTPATVTDRATLGKELAAARRDGWALAVDELDIGLTALAAPVRDIHGHIAASLSVSGPTFRFGPERRNEIVPLLRAAADDVSARLGWRGAD